MLWSNDVAKQMRLRDARLDLLWEMRQSLVILVCCAIALAILNISTKGVYPGCGDPLMKITSAYVIPDTVYEWVFAVLMIIMVVTTTFMFHFWEMNKLPHLRRACAVHKSLLLAGQWSPLNQYVITPWRKNVAEFHGRHTSYTIPMWRRVIFILCQLLLGIALSTPTAIYVMVNNVPLSKAFGWVRNPLALAFVNAVVGAFVVAPLALKLAEFKYNMPITKATSERLIQMNKAEIESMIIITVFMDVFFPFLATTALDENCHRRYLMFSPDMRSSMSEWNIDQMGSAAMRAGFCSRKVFEQFGYVWLTSLCIWTIIAPTLAIIKTHPKIHQLLMWIDRVTAGETYNEYTKVRNASLQVQDDVSRMKKGIVIAVVYGGLLPPLMFVLGFGTVLQLFAYSWVRKLRRIKEVDEFAQELACSILIQIPFQASSWMSHVAIYGILLFVVLDLSFSNGPIRFLMLGCLCDLLSRTYGVAKNKHTKSAVVVALVDRAEDGQALSALEDIRSSLENIAEEIGIKTDDENQRCELPIPIKEEVAEKSLFYLPKIASAARPSDTIVQESFADVAISRHE